MDRSRVERHAAGVSDPKHAASRLWPALEGLARGIPPERATLPVVRIRLDGGTVFEVFRADPVEAAMVAWRVRGFCEGEGASDRLAVILGTLDGRAMVTERVSGESDQPAVAGLVVGVEPGERSLADLSTVIAEAIRAQMDES